MLDRRNLLGRAAAAIALAAVPAIAAAQSTTTTPAAPTERASTGSPRYRRRQSAIAPSEGVVTPTSGDGGATGVHPRRAARQQHVPATEPEISLADADFSEAAGRDGRGARSALP